MEQEKQMNEKESLALIQRMVITAQQGVQDSGFFFLLWGWLVFAASLSSWVLIHFFAGKFMDLPWIILMPAGGLVSMIYGRKVESKKRVKTYADSVLKYVVIAFLASLFIVMGCGAATLGWVKTYSFILIIYGSWLFISGGVLKFRPLIIGGIINWLCAIGSFWIKDYHIILLLAFAVLSGYVIPGHLLRIAFFKDKKDGGV